KGVLTSNPDCAERGVAERQKPLGLVYLLGLDFTRGSGRSKHMAFKTALWSVNEGKLVEQESIVLDSERRLEDWISADLSLLGEDLLLIDRQTRTTSGPLDILAMDADGKLVIAELKRDRTPREVVAQVLDYASWVRERTPREIDELIQRRVGKS